jgi:hypothetical protein
VKAKRRSGVLRVDLSAAESAALGQVFGEFATVLDELPPEDPVTHRLYPDGYTDDEGASAEFRSLVQEDLRAERAARLTACRAELPTDGGRIELDADAADRWIRVLNDLRLALGTRLEVSEDRDLDPEQDGAYLYDWLTAVQDTLVGQLMD